MKRILIFLFLMMSFGVASAQSQLYASSPLLVEIPDDAPLTRYSGLGSIRPGTSDFGVSVYRVSVATANATVTVNSSGRVVNCYIPTTAVATNGSDHHLSVINSTAGYVCELFNAQRVQGSLTNWTADGAYLYPISGNGISPRVSGVVFRTTGSGLSVINYAITMEDVADIQAGRLRHGLSFAPPPSLVNGNSTTGYVSPATAAETNGTGGSTALPMGAVFTLPRDYVVPTDLHPFTQMFLQSVYDYGIITADVSNPPTYSGLPVGTFRIEPAAQAALGYAPDNPNASCSTSPNLLRCIVQAQVYSELQRVGLWRVSNVTVVTPTTAPTRTATRTPTPIGATSTRTPTLTPTGPVVATSTPTNFVFTLHCVFVWSTPNPNCN